MFVDRGAKQCTSDNDCAQFMGATCNVARGVCVASSGMPDSGTPDAGMPDSTPPPKDCLGGPPVNPDDFGNICTTASCIPFDNCAHGLCNDAGLIPPDAGTAPDAGTTPPGDAGVTHLPACTDGNAGKQVIYVTGSSNFPPLLAKLGPLIMSQTGYTPVYQVTSSCNGVKSIFSTTAKDRIMADPAPGSKTATATYVTADGTLVPCAVGTGGVTVDIGESDIYSSSCAGFTDTPGGVGHYLGPIQAMLFVVPSGSTQQVISAEMARAVFGRGGDSGKAAPWTDPTLYFIRNANTGTQQMIGRAIGVPADQFWGIDRSTAANVANTLPLVPSGLVEQAIGIISSDYYDKANGSIKELAFQGVNQKCGYWPDSTPFVKDKRNVRDGHYPIWGPLHFYAGLLDGLPASAAAAAWVQTVIAEPNLDLLNAYVDAGLVPSCAMSVERDSDLGNLRSVPAPVPCTCYFETRIAQGKAPDGCTPCGSAIDCTNPALPACRFGYCEAR